MQPASKKSIIRIEIWHGILLAAVLGSLGQTGFIEPGALLVGGLFIGINFLFLGFGVAWVLTPLAGKRRVTAGVVLLILKVLLFLGLLATIFFRFEIDPLSFSFGISTLLLAIVIESIRTRAKLEI